MSMWIILNLASIVTVVLAFVAVLKYLGQRDRELRARRFEQYWKLIDTCQDSPQIAKQQIALLLLKRYPEFKDETAAFLRESKLKNDPWTLQNILTVNSLLDHFGKRDAA